MTNRWKDSPGDHSIPDTRHSLPLARSRAYTLFGQLYLKGLTPDLRPSVETVQDLAAVLDTPFDADAAATDHHHLLGLNIFPYASLFLDASGRLGGAVTEDVQHRFRQTGYVVEPAGESADHVGHELGLLAFLAGAEADAWADGLPAEAERTRRHQRRFLDTHLLWWLPGFAQALRQQAHPFYTALADLTLELVLDHRTALGPGVEAPPATPLLPDPPALLDEAETGLTDIARYLVTTAWSGFYLSRDDVGRLGRADRLPRGFGHRALILTNLLRAAVEFDRFEQLLEHLGTVLQTWQDHYCTLAARDVPTLTDVAQAWLHRLHTTRHLLDRLQDAASGLGDLRNDG